MSAACGVARREVLASGPRALSAESAKARAHLESCDYCRRFAADMEALAEAVRSAGSIDVAPPEVRERLFARIAEARAASGAAQTSARRVWWITGAAAAALVVAAALLSSAARRAPENALVTAIAQDHATSLAGDRIQSSDRLAVESWLATRLTFAVYVPALEEAQLAGARIGQTPFGRGAVVEYRAAGRPVSYFILPELEGIPVPSQGFRHAHAAGYRAVVWNDMGLTHAMVGALATGMLERLAKDCVRQAHAAVAAVGRWQDSWRGSVRHRVTLTKNTTGGSA